MTSARNLMRAALAVLPLLALTGTVLTGCGSSDDSTSTSAPASGDADHNEFQSVREMRAKFRSAGWHCEDHQVVAEASLEFTDCDATSSVQLVVIPQPSDRAETIRAYRKYRNVLAGNGWIITAPSRQNLEQIRGDMGGTIFAAL